MITKKSEKLYLSYIRSAKLKLIVTLFIEALSIVFLYVLLINAISKIYLYIIMSIYLLSSILMIVYTIKTFKKNSTLLSTFLNRFCKNEASLSKGLNVYICQEKRLIYCLSLDYHYLFIIKLEKLVEENATRLGKTIDFICYRLLSARELSRKERGPIRMFEGEALVPSLKKGNLDLIKGKFVEINLDKIKDEDDLVNMVKLIEFDV